jgi:hypothetical protein
MTINLYVFFCVALSAILAIISITTIYLIYLLATQHKSVSNTYQESLRDVMKFMKARNLAEKVQADAAEKQYGDLLVEAADARAERKVESNSFISKLSRDGIAKDDLGNEWERMY